VPTLQVFQVEVVLGVVRRAKLRQRAAADHVRVERAVRHGLGALTEEGGHVVGQRRDRGAGDVHVALVVPGVRGRAGRGEQEGGEQGEQQFAAHGGLPGGWRGGSAAV